jgi:flavin reductase (DIM6/NTAB) family NADH-FMN oxidoreductase RutF
MEAFPGALIGFEGIPQDFRDRDSTVNEKTIRMGNDSISYRTEDLVKFDKNFRRNFINSLSGYKSVNLVGTIDKKAKTNLAIFNTVIHVGSSPALMGLLVRPPVIPRHTLTNIMDMDSFTINHINPTFYHKAHQTAARYKAEDKSEFDIVGLTPHFTDALKAPYVMESTVKIGLELRETHEIRSNGTIFVVGEIIEVILPERAILTDGLIDLGITGTITASGLDTYYTTRKIARLSYANPSRDLNIIG